MFGDGVKVVKAVMSEDTGRRGQTRQFWNLTLECGHEAVKPARWSKAGKARRDEIMRQYRYAVEDGKIPAWRDGKVTTPVINQRPDDCAPPPQRVERCAKCRQG